MNRLNVYRELALELSGLLTDDWLSKLTSKLVAWLAKKTKWSLSI